MSTVTALQYNNKFLDYFTIDDVLSMSDAVCRKIYIYQCKIGLYFYHIKFDIPYNIYLQFDCCSSAVMRSSFIQICLSCDAASGSCTFYSHFSTRLRFKCSDSIFNFLLRTVISN